jgi:GrpB-like predicted nucleotidyltransferase (UPF0157 family)
MRLIEIIPYQDRWVTEFHETGAKLRQALGDLAIRIDHIGSTSIPGLGAKDIVDIQVTVASLDPAELIVEAIVAIGFQWRPNNLSDDPPAGDTRPAREWRKLYFREPEGSKRTHIHVRAQGSAGQRYALLFRDFLRSNPDAAMLYERTKREAARLHPHDIDGYLAVKGPIMDRIINAAEDWAAHTNWLPSTSDA